MQLGSRPFLQLFEMHARRALAGPPNAFGVRLSGSVL